MYFSICVSFIFSRHLDMALKIGLQRVAGGFATRTCRPASYSAVPARLRLYSQAAAIQKSNSAQDVQEGTAVSNFSKFQASAPIGPQLTIKTLREMRASLTQILRPTRPVLPW